MTLSTKNPAREWLRGGAIEMVHAGSLNGDDATTASAWFKAFRLVQTRALLPYSTAALALLGFGGRADD